MEVAIEDMTMEEYENMIREKDGQGLVRRSIAGGNDNHRMYKCGYYQGNNRVYRHGPPEFYAEDSAEPLFPEKKVNLEEAMAELLTIFNDFTATSRKRIEENEAALASGNIFESFTALSNTNVFYFQEQEKEREIQVNDTTPDPPIVNSSPPRIHKWLRVKNDQAQILSQPKPVVEPYCPPIPFPAALRRKSGKFLDSSLCNITNEFVEIAQEIIEEDWFDALLLEDAEDVGSKKNQVLEEGERMVVNNPCSMEAFDSENGPQELEEDGKKVSENIVEEKATIEEDVLISKEIRRIQVNTNTPYSSEKLNTPYSAPHQYGVFVSCNENRDFAMSADGEESPKPTLKELPTHLEYAFLQGTSKFPVIISSKLTFRERDKCVQDTSDLWHKEYWSVTDDTHAKVKKDYFDKKVRRQGVYIMNKRDDDALIRETKEWHDAWMKRNERYEVSKEALLFGNISKQASEEKSTRKEGEGNLDFHIDNT